MKLIPILVLGICFFALNPVVSSALSSKDADAALDKVDKDDGKLEEPSTGGQVLVEEPKEAAPAVPKDRYKKEETVLSNRRLVLKPPLKPRMSLGIRPGFSLLPFEFFGIPHAEEFLQMEYMVVANLTMVFRLGNTQVLDYSGRKSTWAESEPGKPRKDGGWSIASAGFGGRLRLDEEIKGLYMGLSAHIAYFKGLSILSKSKDDTETDVVKDLFLANALMFTGPILEIGYTMTYRRFFFEAGLDLGVGFVFLQGKYKKLDDFDAMPDPAEVVKDETRIPFFIHVQGALNIGVRLF